MLHLLYFEVKFAGSVVKIADSEYEECVIMFHVELHLTPPPTEIYSLNAILDDLIFWPL